MENNLAIIPARSGSKRIYKKNIKLFLGKPILAYSIELAKSSGLFSEIMVSTDDNETANIAQSFGAQIPFLRSTKNADDFATLNDVLIETISCYSKLGSTFDFVCIILPTAPLISTSNLKKSYKILKSENYDSVRPIVKFSYPIQRSYRLVNNKIEMINPEYLTVRS